MSDLFSLHTTVNLPETEFEFEVEHKLSLGALEDTIATIFDENPEATSFVFSVVCHKAEVPA